MCIKSTIEKECGNCLNKEMVIETFARVIADIQREADVLYYKPEIPGYNPKANKNDESGFKLNEIIKLRKMCDVFGITKEVYDFAYTVYDFRNSGREGYGLVDGKIVKVEENK